jgi:hypothetical protein
MSSTKDFREIESELDRMLEGAGPDLVALGIEASDRSDRFGRDGFMWSYQFDLARESGGLVRRVDVWLSYNHPRNPGATPPVRIDSRAEIFQRGSAANLREWRESSSVTLSELRATGLKSLLCAWISKCKKAIGEPT